MVLPSILLLMFIFFQSTPVKGQHCEELLKYRVDMEELLVRMHTSDSVSYFTAVLKKNFLIWKVQVSGSTVWRSSNTGSSSWMTFYTDNKMD